MVVESIFNWWSTTTQDGSIDGSKDSMASSSSSSATTTSGASMWTQDRDEPVGMSTAAHEFFSMSSQQVLSSPTTKTGWTEDSTQTVEIQLVSSPERSPTTPVSLRDRSIDKLQRGINSVVPILAQLHRASPTTWHSDQAVSDGSPPTMPLFFPPSSFHAKPPPPQLRCKRANKSEKEEDTKPSTTPKPSTPTRRESFKRACTRLSNNSSSSSLPPSSYSSSSSSSSNTSSSNTSSSNTSASSAHSKKRKHIKTPARALLSRKDRSLGIVAKEVLTLLHDVSKKASLPSTIKSQDEEDEDELLYVNYTDIFCDVHSPRRRLYDVFAVLTGVGWMLDRDRISNLIAVKKNFFVNWEDPDNKPEERDADHLRKQIARLAKQEMNITRQIVKTKRHVNDLLSRTKYVKFDVVCQGFNLGAHQMALLIQSTCSSPFKFTEANLPDGLVSIVVDAKSPVQVRIVFRSPQDASITHAPV